MVKKKNNFEDLIEEAVDNIRSDRKETMDLLKDLQAWMIGPNSSNNLGTSDRHREVGFTLAKYVEVLQRSNEQLVKIASLNKKNEEADSELSEKDRSDIFDELHKNKTIKLPPVKEKPKK